MSSSREPGVLIIAASWSSRGGLKRHLVALAASIARHRDVTVLTWGGPTRARSRVDADGVRVVVVPAPFTWDRERSPLAAAINTIVSVATGVLAALLLRRRWSVVVAAGLHPEGTVAALAAGRTRRLVVTTWLVGSLGNAERLRRSAGRAAVVGLLKRARWLVAETGDAAAELTALGFASDRVRVVGAGVDLRRFRPRVKQPQRSPNSERHLAVYAGRFDLRQKRLDVLLDAWREAALVGWELVLAGTGEDEPVVRRIVGSMANAHVLEWQDDVPALLASAELFVLPTVAETSALAMLEAMACGLPGIVSDVPGLASRRPDGVLLAANRPAAWIEALRAVDALDAAGRHEAGRRARAWVEVHGDCAQSHEQWLQLLA
jgi:glycosyltransferase involved in cell wall biosynthesis